MFSALAAKLLCILTPHGQAPQDAREREGGGRHRVAFGTTGKDSRTVASRVGRAVQVEGYVASRVGRTVASRVGRAVQVEGYVELYALFLASAGRGVTEVVCPCARFENRSVRVRSCAVVERRRQRLDNGHVPHSQVLIHGHVPRSGRTSRGARQDQQRRHGAEERPGAEGCVRRQADGRASLPYRALPYSTLPYPTLPFERAISGF